MLDLTPPRHTSTLPKAGNQQARSIDGTRGTSTIAGGSSSPLGAPSGCVDFVEEHMPLTDKLTRDRIRDLNDTFRKTVDPTLGRMMLTAGVDALPSDVRAMAIRKVTTFDAFGAENDPHGEHDFGSFDLAEHKFFFKLDYYDPRLEFGSDDPTDPAKTTRVLTLMLAEEY
jgi:hypothetical protein